MPRRRTGRGSRILGGLGQGLADISTALLGQRMIGKRQVEQQEANLLAQELSSFNTDVNQMLSPENVARAGPGPVQSQYGARRKMLSQAAQKRLGAEPDFASLEAPVEVRLTPARKRIAEASTPEGVPSESELKMLLEEARIPPEVEWAMGGLEIPGLSNKVTTKPFVDLSTEAKRKRSDLEAAAPRVRVEGIGPQGQGTATYKTNRELANVGEVQTERTPEQEASRQGGIRKATAQAEQDVLNDPRNVKGFASREQAVAFARGMGGLQADQRMGAGSFKPETDIKEEVTPDGRTVYRVIQVQPQSGAVTDKGVVDTPNYKGPTTDSERKAWSFATRGIEAHNRMLGLEQKLANRPFVVNLAMLNAPEAIKDPLSRQYVQQMRVMINSLLGRPESGGAITEEEFKTYGQANAYTAGVDPATLKNIQNDRRLAARGLVMQAGPRLGEQFVTMPELERLAQQSGTTVDQQLAEAQASGYRVIR